MDENVCFCGKFNQEMGRSRKTLCPHQKAVAFCAPGEMVIGPGPSIACTSAMCRYVISELLHALPALKPTDSPVENWFELISASTGAAYYS